MRSDPLAFGHLGRATSSVADRAFWGRDGLAARLRRADPVVLVLAFVLHARAGRAHDATELVHDRRAERILGAVPLLQCVDLGSGCAGRARPRQGKPPRSRAGIARGCVFVVPPAWSRPPLREPCTFQARAARELLAQDRNGTAQSLRSSLPRFWPRVGSPPRAHPRSTSAHCDVQRRAKASSNSCAG